MFDAGKLVNETLLSDISKFYTRLNGSSSFSETYGNPCLAFSEDFEVKEIEVSNALLSLSLSPFHTHVTLLFASLIHMWLVCNLITRCHLNRTRS